MMYAKNEEGKLVQVKPKFPTKIATHCLICDTLIYLASPRDAVVCEECKKAILSLRKYITIKNTELEKINEGKDNG